MAKVKCFNCGKNVILLVTAPSLKRFKSHRPCSEGQRCLCGISTDFTWSEVDIHRQQLASWSQRSRHMQVGHAWRENFTHLWCIICSTNRRNLVSVLILVTLGSKIKLPWIWCWSILRYNTLYIENVDLSTCKCCLVGKSARKPFKKGN